MRPLGPANRLIKFAHKTVVTKVIELPHEAHPLILPQLKSSMTGDLLQKLKFRNI